MTQKTEMAYLAAKTILQDAGVPAFILAVAEEGPPDEANRPTIDGNTIVHGSTVMQSMLVCRAACGVIGCFERK